MRVRTANEYGSWVVVGVLAGCGGYSGRADGEASGTQGTTGVGVASTGVDEVTSSGVVVTTSGTGETGSGNASTGTGTSSEGGSSEGPGSSEGGSTGAPLPDFDALPWQTGDDIGYGVAYKDSGDPNARNVFIGYAGYPFPLDASESWVTALYHARLRELGVRHVYAVQGPATVMYEDLEIGNTSIAEALTSQAADAAFVLVAGHSSGSYVAHELLGQLAAGWDPQGVTQDKVVYFNLDGGTAYLEQDEVDRLRAAYFVSVFDGGTNTAAPNLDAMKYLATKFPDKGAYLELDGGGSGCNGGANWCLHMVVINSLPHDPWDSSVTDYYDFVGRPVVTGYIDNVAEQSGLHP